MGGIQENYKTDCSRRCESVPLFLTEYGGGEGTQARGGGGGAWDGTLHTISLRSFLSI